jgi:5'-3' exonuclease
MNENIVDIVISEDSDLIVYGCSRILFKLSKDGYGDEIQRNKLGLNTDMKFTNWTDEQFKLFCCLAGCDYITRIKNIGIKKAYKIIENNKTFDKIIKSLKKDKEFNNIDMHGYIYDLKKAYLTFKHQTIFDPRRINSYLQPLTQFPTDCPDIQLISELGNIYNNNDNNRSQLDFLGPIFDDEIAIGKHEIYIYIYNSIFKTQFCLNLYSITT